MPKDEFDPEDPLELNGMVFSTPEDTTGVMAECFIEEFRRMGYSHEEVLALFHDPQYLGPHLACEQRGEPFIRDLIAEVFARRGKPVTWGDSTSNRCQEAQTSSVATGRQDLATVPAATALGAAASGETNGPIPKLNLQPCSQ